MKSKEDLEREHRIELNVLVDTYSEYEILSSWHAYLQDELSFPFKIKGEDGVPQTVTDLCNIEEFDGEFYVEVKVGNDQIMEGLRDLQIEETETKQAIEDWKYFCDRGLHHYLTENEEDQWD